LILGTVLAIVAATAGVSYVRERKAWEDKVAAVEGTLAQLRTETAQRVDALRQEATEKDRVIAERRADSQKFAALMDKTLVELKASLETMRSEERERSERTEMALKKALEHRVPPLSEVLRVWIPEWLRR
jgi:septal ring factor EnvC (AmiA/AmiB activator)